MRFIYCCIYFAVSLCVCSVCAQEPAAEEIVENLGAETAESPDLDAIERFAARPLNLRQISARELSAIPGFSISIARRLLRLVKTLPDSTTIETLADSLQLSAEQYLLLQSCTVLGESAELTKPSKIVLWRSRSTMRLQRAKGFRTGKFQGSEYDVYQRLQVNTPIVSGCMLINKDAGEKSFADFISGYAELRTGAIRGIIGDFTVSSGMGGILWRQFGLRKGVSVISPTGQYGSGISASRSALEFGFFRGGAAEYTTSAGDSSSLTLTAFASFVLRSATIDTNGYATSLKIDGLFRTESDETRRAALPETAIGTIAEYRTPSFVATAAALTLKYGYPVVSTASTAFSGTNGSLFSLSGIWILGESSQISCEFSQDANSNSGGKAALMFFGKNISAAFGMRIFNADFRSPFGYSFGEFSAPDNEYGFYSAAEWRGKGMQIYGYADIYGSLQPRFGMTRPTRGIDFLAESRNVLPTGAYLILRARLEQKNDAFSMPEMRADYNVERISLRAEYSRKTIENLMLRLRAEAVRVSFGGIKPVETGAVGFFEAQWQAADWLRLGARVAQFATDSYASARWTFEYALPGSMSNPALYGTGTRTFFVAAITPIKLFTARILYAATSKNGVTYLGSGYDEILGSTDSRLTFQIDAAW